VLRPSRPEPSRETPSASGTQPGLQGHDRRAQPDQWSLVTLKAPTQPVLRQQPGALGPQPVTAAYGPKIEARALTPCVLVQRFLYATLGGRSLGLGVVDRRLGQLGDPINGCDRIYARRTARG
jgi:hypothetical protein